MQDRCLIARVRFDHTLMRLDPELGVHVPEPPLPKTWFLEIPASWRGHDQRIAHALQKIFAAENERLRANQPDDPNFLAALGSHHEIVDPPEAGPFPWESEARAVWEASTCWTSTAPDTGTPWIPVDPAMLTARHLARRGARQ